MKNHRLNLQIELSKIVTRDITEAFICNCSNCAPYRFRFFECSVFMSSISNSRRFCWRIVSSIKPENKDCIAAITTNPQTISVGYFPTMPVLVYSTNIGMKNIRENKVNRAEIMQKNYNGLYVLNNFQIVFRTLKPSE